jgi:hypothetical protein
MGDSFFEWAPRGWGEKILDSGAAVFDICSRRLKETAELFALPKLFPSFIGRARVKGRRSQAGRVSFGRVGWK